MKRLLLGALCAAVLLFCLLRFPNGSIRVMSAFGRLLSVFLILTLILLIIG